MIRPRQALFFLLILVTISSGYALDAQLENVAVTIILHADGSGDVFYNLTYDVSAGELHGFYFEGMAVEPVFVREDCFALLESGSTVPLEIKKLAEKYYDVVLADERGFSGTAEFHLHYLGDIAAAGSLRKATDSAGIEYYRFDWSPVQWATPVDERSVRVVLPVEVSGERVKDDVIEKLEITISPETEQENDIMWLGSKGDTEKYLLTAQFYQVDVAPYQVQHIEFAAPVDTIDTYGKEYDAGSTAPALSPAKNRYSRERRQRFYSPVIFFVLAAAVGSSAFLLFKKRRSLSEASGRYESAAFLEIASQRSQEAGREASVRPQYRFFSLPHPLRLLLYSGFVLCGLVFQFLVSFSGHAPIGLALVVLSGVVVTMQSGAQYDGPTASRERPDQLDQWIAIDPDKIMQIKKNLEIEEIKKEPLLIKKTASRVLYFSLFGFLLFFAAVLSGITGLILPLFAGTDIVFIFYPIFITGFIDARKIRELILKLDRMCALLHYVKKQDSALPLRPFAAVYRNRSGEVVLEDVLLRVAPDSLPQGVRSVEFKPIVRRGVYGLFSSMYAVCYPEDQSAEKALVSGEWFLAEGSNFILRRVDHMGTSSVEVRFPLDKEEQLDPPQQAVLLYGTVEKKLFSLDIV
jgi:hypothetical protein